MIVRESPKKRAQNQPQNWPPKSPHEALLSSPSGRRKYERQRERNSVSPSPSKHRPVSRGLLDLQENSDDEDEDEETLQLELARIEARLKLKKLQKARKAHEASDDGDNDSTRASSRPGTSASLRRADLPRPQAAIQVPVSPTRNSRASKEQTSPARVLLGIDKGLRAQDVSLKRAASLHTRANAPGLLRASSLRDTEAPRVKSFSERIAESRNKDKEREEKQARIEKSRSTGFSTKTIESLREGAPSRVGSSLSTETRSSCAPSVASRREEIPKSRSIGDLRHAAQKPSTTFSSRSDSRAPSAASSHAAPSRPMSKTAVKYAEIAERDNSTDAASFDSFSGLHLKTRLMQHKDLTRILEGKTVITIPQLLKTVKAPEYDPPDMENDYVVFGVICSKSPPKDTQNARKEQSAGNQGTNSNQGGKFMMMNLTDLKWELGLYLFDTGFSEFWKLPVGTLIAILNPDIMPPRVRDTGKFSLKLTSSDDTVLEVGTVRDLDYCHALKQGGKECGQWIDGRKTEYCDFHIERHVEKSKRGRMEVNTMTGFGNGPNGGGKFGMFAGGAGRGAGLKTEELKREGMFHDRTLHETMYIAPSVGAAARLLDEADNGFERGASRAERHRKQLAEKEKERELAKRLGQIGSGAGGDYMKLKGTDISDLPARGDSHTQSSNTSKENSSGFGDLLGLAGKKADDVSLAPVKRKRVISGKSTGTSDPVGWGGANRRGLLLSPKKELGPSARQIRETSPIKKKARLLLPEKGIREPGRESLGTMDVGLLAAMDDDDDDLEVV